jgi:hypothetical protein
MPNRLPDFSEAVETVEPDEAGETLWEENQRLAAEAAQTCAQARELLRNLESTHPSAGVPSNTAGAAKADEPSA